MMQKTKIIVSDADAFAHNTDRALVVVEISRHDIESCYLASALERLQILTDSAENTRLYRESIVLSVDGYNSDPRELVEIPEVRVFFQKLTEQWPNWLWFLNREIGSVGLLLSLLCDVNVHRIRGSYSTEFESILELKRKISELLDRGNALFDTYGITEQEAQESLASVLAEIDKPRH